MAAFLTAIELGDSAIIATQEANHCITHLWIPAVTIPAMMVTS